MKPSIRQRVLAFSALVEIGTSLLLLVDPGLVVQLLVGEPAIGVAALIGRCFGIALLGLGIACWPQVQQVQGASAPLHGMALYNALVALYLGYLGAVVHMGAVLLWPAVALHAFVALLLSWPVSVGRHVQST